MELPYWENAYVPTEKLSEYLLNENHPKGRFNAEFFLRFGYSVVNASELGRVLVNHVRENGIVKEVPSPFGVRYVSEGPMQGADGRRPNVRSVWFIEIGSSVPRLVSAYPLEDDEHD